MAQQIRAMATAPTYTLPAWRLRSLLFQTLLVGAAVALPSSAHLVGAPVRILLSMHWPVILAGLVYGLRGGAAVGLLAPAASFLVSGLPAPVVLPAMTAELFIYGGLTGLLVEKLRVNGFAAVTLALIAGRLVFAAVAVLTGYVAGDYQAYFLAALAPGLVAALVQIFTLPPLSRLWIAWEGERREQPDER